MKILIVDDDQAIADTWTMAFEKEGFEVIRATGGQEGIDKAKSDLPDLILLDQIMPDRIGNEVLSALKTDPQMANIPVILLSNYSESKMMNDAIEEGAVDYILKYQIETSDLIAKIKSVLADSKKAQETKATTPTQ